MTTDLKPGLYEQLLTRELEDVLRAVDQTRLAIERARSIPPTLTSRSHGTCTRCSNECFGRCPNTSG